MWVSSHRGQQQHWHCDTALHDIQVATCSPAAVGCHFRLTYMTFVAAHATLPSHYAHMPPAAKTFARQVAHILRFVCIFCLSDYIYDTVSWWHAPHALRRFPSTSVTRFVLSPCTPLVRHLPLALPFDGVAYVPCNMMQGVITAVVWHLTFYMRVSEISITSSRIGCSLNLSGVFSEVSTDSRGFESQSSRCNYCDKTL